MRPVVINRLNDRDYSGRLVIVDKHTGNARVERITRDNIAKLFDAFGYFDGYPDKCLKIKEILVKLLVGDHVDLSSNFYCFVPYRGIKAKTAEETHLYFLTITILDNHLTKIKQFIREFYQPTIKKVYKADRDYSYLNNDF